MSNKTVDIKALRTRLGLTQKELAEKLNYNPYSISKAENGYVSRNLIFALKIYLDEYYREEGDKIKVTFPYKHYLKTQEENESLKIENKKLKAENNRLRWLKTKNKALEDHNYELQKKLQEKGIEY